MKMKKIGSGGGVQNFPCRSASAYPELSTYTVHIELHCGGLFATQESKIK